MPPTLKTLNTYFEPEGSQRVPVVIENHSERTITVRKGVCIGALERGDVVKSPAKEVGAVPSPPADSKNKLTVEERKKALSERLDWTGIDAQSPAVAAAARELMYEFHDIFSLDPMELGKCDLTQHKIVLDDETPFQERYRKIPPHHQQEVRELLDEMLRQGTVVPSNSPYRSAVVLVKKKDGSLRMCIDYRRLNKQTKRDAFPLPRIEETVNDLSKARYFSTVDLKWGFWQIEVDPESRAYTAFTLGPLGFFECTRMPFGLTNAPSTFQRAITTAMTGIEGHFAHTYLDDVITYSPGDWDHLTHLRRTFERYRRHGLKLKPEKCTFFAEYVNFLGYRVARGEILPLDTNIQAIKDFPQPTNYTEVKGFLGMAGHYRRFIKDFAKKSKPLVELTAGEHSKKKKEAVQLGPAEIEAYETLKRELISAPVMRLPRLDEPFILEVDASGKALGAVLSQRQEDGKPHPVAYGSKVLNAAERRYHSTKQEFLAVKWALTEAFKPYLLGAPVEIWTDSNPLTYVLTTPNLDATGHRWVAAMANHNFSLKYRKGITNVVADTLSRPPSTAESEAAEEVSLPADAVKQLLDFVSRKEIPASVGVHSVLVQQQAARDELSCYEVNQALSSAVTVDESADSGLGGPTLVAVASVASGEPNAEWQALQREDPFLDALHQYLALPATQRSHARFLELTSAAETGEEPALKEVREQYRRQKGRLVLRRGLLYRQVQGPTEMETYFQLLLPASGHSRSEAIKGCHQEAGHQGFERSLSLLRERFWWPGMRPQLRQTIDKCARCTRFKAGCHRDPLQTVWATYPLDLIHVDHLAIERRPNPDESGHIPVQQVLVVTDHFTRYARAFPVPNLSARTTARVLARDYFMVHGVPARILTDQGKSFTSKLVKELCAALNVQLLRTSPYHPQTNGQVERFNRTLINMLGTLETDKKDGWPDYLNALTHAYNCTRTQVTGYSPYFLMYGRRPKLPVDVLYPTVLGREAVTASDYVAELQAVLSGATQLATKQSQVEAARQKRNYDRTAESALLRPGDIVLTRLVTYRGLRKIADKWGDEPHEVVGQLASNLSVYKLLSCQTKKSKVLHRNRLLLIEPAPLSADSEPEE
jgi:transposase InsO family protein